MIKQPLRTETIRENTVRYTQRIDGDVLDDNLKSLVQLLKDLIENPVLLRCGNFLPRNITLNWDGDKWIFTSIAEDQIDMTTVFYSKEE